MRYKILTSEIDATSMDKYTYLKDIEKVPIQHLENKRIKGSTVIETSIRFE